MPFATAATLLVAFGMLAIAARAASPAAGGPVDLLTEANVRIDGQADGDNAGIRVAGAGDVNGDGLADVLLGAEMAGNNGRSISGSAYVVFGQAAPNNVDLASLGSSGFRIDGASGSDQMGTVAGAGDVNGDGMSDVIVGASGADNNGRMDSGSAYVIFGKTSTATVDLASLGSSGFRIDGDSATDAAGSAVGGVGDMNGDGAPELLVGAPFTGNNGRSSSGSAYVVFGKSSTAAIDLASLGAGGFRLDGASSGDNLTTAGVSGAGDVNGDGTSDVILSAPPAGNNGLPAAGSAYVVFGKSSTTAVDLASLGSGGFRIDGAAAIDQMGTVAGTGDINGDGFADAIVGASSADNNGRPSSGSAYVVFGKSSTTTVNLAALGGGGFEIDGAAPGDGAGVAVGAAGDVNGDAILDVIVGASGSGNNGRTGSGSTYVVFGRTATTTIDLASLGSAGFRVDGAADSDSSGFSVAGPGDVNGDGRADVLIGAPFAGNNGRSFSGSAYLVHSLSPSAAGGGGAGRDPVPASPPGGSSGGGRDPVSPPPATEGPPGPGADRTRPVLAGVSMTVTSFRVVAFPARRGSDRRLGDVPTGTEFRYGLSEPARVNINIDRRYRGSIPGGGGGDGGGCKSATHRRPRRAGGRRRAKVGKVKRGRIRRGCVRLSRVGRISRFRVAGAHRQPWSGWLRGRPVPPGNYQAAIVARDAAGNHSNLETIPFVVAR